MSVKTKRSLRTLFFALFAPVLVSLYACRRECRVENCSHRGFSLTYRRVEGKLGNCCYLINDHIEWRSGKGVYFVNGPQIPGVRISRIDSQIAPTTKGSWSLKPVVVKQNKTFEVEVEALGQSGTITILSQNLGLGSTNATIVGPQSLYVVANDRATFNVQPTGNMVSLQDIEIRSSCGSSGTNIGEIRIPIQQSLDSKTVPPIQLQPPTPLPVIEPRPTVKPTPPNAIRPVSVSIKNLIITPSRSLQGIVEGDTVAFSARLVMSDGSRRPAAGKIAWSVVGKIGSVNSNGVFTAALDSSIAELGESVGAVTAVFTDTTGNVFLGTSPTFTVTLFIPDESEIRG